MAKQKITENTVKKVAELARLSLSQSEIKQFQKDLNDILIAFEELDKAKANCEPSFHVLDIRDVVRKDKAEEPLEQKKALSNTKHKQEGYFKGPKVM